MLDLEYGYNFPHRPLTEFQGRTTYGCYVVKYAEYFALQMWDVMASCRMARWVVPEMWRGETRTMEWDEGKREQSSGTQAMLLEEVEKVLSDCLSR